MEHKLPPRRPRSFGRYVNFATAATNALANALLAKHDLTLQQWVVLSALWQKDGLSVSEIADYTGNAGPATSRILDRMIEKELVTRREDPRDRRSSQISLGAKGQTLRFLSDFHSEINGILLDGLTEEEADILRSLLERLTENARRAIGDSREG